MFPFERDLQLVDPFDLHETKKLEILSVKTLEMLLERTFRKSIFQSCMKNIKYRPFYNFDSRSQLLLVNYIAKDLLALKAFYLNSCTWD